MRAGGVVVLAVMVGAAAPPPGASSCSGCHGGVSPVPVLAGRKAGDIIAAMDAFRTGVRQATVMDRIAKGFTPDETAAIAGWWAEQK